MAMLAEPKSKQKWSSDPRNTTWTNDTNRFGYQMLTKMGWESGKGLGAKEDGATAHVKSAKRRDNLGLGADKSNEDNWLSHQLAFDDLLSHLNNHSENGGEQEKPKKKRKKHEMEKTARQSRKRVFYNRFIQSKDLSSKSAEDMACIFGQRSKSAPGTPQEQSEGEESDDSTASCPPPSFHGVQTINTGQSIQEYFEMKMKEMKAARESRELEGEKKEEIIADEVGENGPKNSVLGDEESKSKKKKKEKGRKRKSATEACELKNDKNGSLSVEDECSVKKKKKTAETEYAKPGEENECKVQVLQETKRGKEKKKKRRGKEVIDLETYDFDGVQSEKMVESLQTVEKVVKDGKKKNKNNKKKEKITVVDLEISSDSDKEDQLKRARNSGEDKSCKESLTEAEEVKEKGKKRKRKDKHFLSDNMDIIETGITEEKKKKKKKKDKSKEIRR